MLIGMCLAWAWGLVTMKAAFAARPQDELNLKLQDLGKMASSIANSTGVAVPLVQRKLILDGFLLDTRVTVVFFAMGNLFIYFLARLRCANAKMTLTQIFGTIITDLFLLTAPTLPKFNGTLPKVLIEPGCIGIGIGLVCNLLLFPKSTSWVVLDKMEALIRTSEVSLNRTSKRLSEDGNVEIAELKAAKGGLLALYKSALPDLAFLPMDFARARWGADDIKELQGKVREYMTACLSMLDVHIGISTAREARKRQEDKEKDAFENGSRKEKGSDTEDGRSSQDNEGWVAALQEPELGLSDVRARTKVALNETTKDILAACKDTIKLVADLVHVVNHTRWYGRNLQQEEELMAKLEAASESLQAQRASSLSRVTESVLETHAGLFDEDGNCPARGSDPFLLRGIVLSMVVEERILKTAETLQALLDHVIGLSKNRPDNRLWMAGFSHGVSWALDDSNTVPIVSEGPLGGFDNPEDPISSPETLRDDAKEAHRRLRVSRVHYGTAAAHKNKFVQFLARTLKWFTDPSGMYALRMVAVTIATSCPAVIPHTAGFFYREKGIWLVITAQTTLMVYMGDLFFSVIARTLGTILGGLLGMLAWYIGSGNGGGNPYGLGAITFFLIAIIMWSRLYSGPAWSLAAIMGGATFILVVGFSYDDTHLPQYGLPGLGYTAFWKRVVTVLAGFAASVLVQLLPTPPSAWRHMSETLGNTVRTLSDHYALLISHWGRPEHDSPLGAVAEELSIEVAEGLLSLAQPLALLKLELSLGPFDAAMFANVQEQCEYVNQALGRLLDLTSSLPQEFQERLSFTSGIADDHIVGDVMAVLSIIEQSLRTGRPLPERLPGPLVKRYFEMWQKQAPNVVLSKTLVRDENYRRYCVALSSYFKFLRSIDRLVEVLKESLGECHIIHQWEST